MKLALRTLNGVITAILVAAVLGASGLAIAAKRSRDSIPTIMGHKVLTVLSGSMQPTIHTGDVIVVKPLNDPARQVKDGDVVTYRAKVKPDMLITHRVVGTVLVNGKVAGYTTRGDANGAEDMAMVSPVQVIGRYQWRVPYFGYISAYMHSIWGTVLGVILPGLLIIGLEFRKMWQTLSEAQGAKTPSGKGEGGEPDVK